MKSVAKYLVLLLMLALYSCSGSERATEKNASKQPKPPAKGDSRQQIETPPPKVHAQRVQKIPYDIVKVFYATDRAPTGSHQPNEFYGNGRWEVQFGMCEVSIPHNHQQGELESPSIWRFEIRENPRKHIVLLDVRPAEGVSFINALRNTIESTAAQEAFIFIHGYNVTFKDAARRTAQIAHDLKFQGAPIMYSWPSKGTYKDYAADKTTAEWSEARVAHFIEAVAHESGARKIHLIAHSMGNRLLTRAMRQMVNSPFTGKLPKINQVILTAPDIDAQIFREQIADKIVQVSDRITIYASNNDKALSASRAVNGGIRLGQGGKFLQRFPNMKKIETIDASELDTSLFELGHSYYGDQPSVIFDIAQVLRGQSSSERGLLAVQPGGWILNAARYSKAMSNRMRR